MSTKGKRAQGVTRRVLVAALAALPASAQVASPVPPTGVPGAPPADDLQKAYANVKQASDRLANLSVPMALEPAFAFHV